MILKTHIPSEPLNKYVESFTYSKGYNPEHSIEKLLPDASVNIVIELDEIPRYTFENDTLAAKHKYINAWVSGMQTSFISISAEKHSCMFVIKFRAGGSFPFFHIPLTELNDLVIDAELIFGNEILILREKLVSAHTQEAMFPLVENWLIKRARQSTLPEAVVDFAVTNIITRPTLNDVKSISQKTGYSQKQFIHIFKKHVGITPKKYQRIVRFNKALQEIEKFNKIDWSSISYDCGYFDQAHFINEFKYFSGINPTDYLIEKGEFLNYIPIFDKR